MRKTAARPDCFTLLSSYGCFMKKQFLNATLLATTAVTATLFTGCASMNRAQYSGTEEPINALAFTTVTDPVELGKWTGSRFLHLGMRGMDTYYFQVPSSDYGGFFASNDSARIMTDSPDMDARPVQSDGTRTDVGSMGTTDLDRTGSLDRAHRDSVGSPGAYQTGVYQSDSGSYKIIRHQPGSAR